jgi:anti-sigma B factor antagonist
LNEISDNEILNVSTCDGVLIVSFNQASIGGMADIAGVGDTLRGLVGDRHPNKMVIDFSSVSFFSSQMLGLLVDIWRRMKDTGGAVVISGINPQLTRVFRITHLDKVFQFYESPAAAIDSLQA